MVKMACAPMCFVFRQRKSCEAARLCSSAERASASGLQLQTQRRLHDASAASGGRLAHAASVCTPAALNVLFCAYSAAVQNSICMLDDSFGMKVAS